MMMMMAMVVVSTSKLFRPTDGQPTAFRQPLNSASVFFLVILFDLVFDGIDIDLPPRVTFVFKGDFQMLQFVQEDPDPNIIQDKATSTHLIINLIQLIYNFVNLFYQPNTYSNNNF